MKTYLFIILLLFGIISFFGITENINYLLLPPVVISLVPVSILILEYNTKFLESLSVFMSLMLISSIILLLIVNTMRTFIDKTPELSSQITYNIKYMENNQIIVEDNNKLRIIDSENLYNNCLNIKCKFITVDTYIYRPVNKKLAKNIFGEKLDILNIK